MNPRSTSPTTESRIAGCLLGGAIGDALGAGVEFDSYDAIIERHGPGGVTNYEQIYGRQGAITDDTQMTLFTADALLAALAESAEPSQDRCVELAWDAYQRWLLTQRGMVEPGASWLDEIIAKQGPRAPGNTCLSALAGGTPGTIEAPINDSKGCGAVMRAAPVGLAGLAEPLMLGARIGALTHTHPSGYWSAGAFALLVHLLKFGVELESALDQTLAALAAHPTAAETITALQTALVLVEIEPLTGAAIEQLGGGWVGEEALAMAVAAVLSHPNDVERCLSVAITHSGDSDSVGAIAGNIMGVRLGVEALPVRWLEQLEDRSGIERVATQLAAATCSGPSSGSEGGSLG